jgi:hypothetical protein
MRGACTLMLSAATRFVDERLRVLHDLQQVFGSADGMMLPSAKPTPLTPSMWDLGCTILGDRSVSLKVCR